MESKERNDREPRKADVRLCEELLRAARRGDTERVRELLQCEGVDSRYAEMGRKTSLCLACAGGHVETTLVLLEHGGETQEELKRAFYGACANGHASMVKLLLERGFDPTLENNYAVRYACSKGHFEVVELLLQDPRVDPAASDNDAVHWASTCGHIRILKMLLADRRVDGTNAIPDALSRALSVLFEDERCGINVNRALFKQFHSVEVLRYDKLVAERSARICAVSWVMKQIGQGWGDLREPLEERMGAQSVFDNNGLSEESSENGSKESSEESSEN